MYDRQLDERTTESSKLLSYKDGRFYFSKKTERNFFFALTVAIPLIYILSEIGWL
jgi:hypothetical protein